MTSYRALAALLIYPEEDFGGRVADAIAAIRRESPQSGDVLAQAQAAAESLSNDELQELYTRSFDLDPACTLEIGWHLYGEDYRRGEFLVKMRQQMRLNQIEESIELPDHLTHVLQLLDTMEPEEAREFAGECLLPAMDKMSASWKKIPAPFDGVLEALFALLKSRFDYQPQAVPFSVPELRIIQ
jgi:nitrate reductase delta subunit